jgi:DHA2 family methylenomycin A resistance protein-like MFS transporter
VSLAARPGTVASRRWLLLGLSLGYFLVMLDTTIVTVALPALGTDLGGGLAALQWVSNGYPVTFAALLLPAGALADRFGPRRVFLRGLLLFLVLSAASAFSPSVAVLVALRALLGAAGALLVPASLAVLATAYPEPAARAKALGVWAALSGCGLVAGPVAGGLLTDTFGWRAVFLVAVPVAAAALALTVRAAVDGPDGQGRPGRSLDVPGQVTAVAGLAALAYALIRGGTGGWTAPDVLGSLAVFVAAAIGFVAAESRPSAMLPLHLFRIRTFTTGVVAGLVVNFGLSGVLFVLSLYWQDTRAFSAAAAGLVLLPLTVPTAVNPILTGRLVARTGPRRPAVLGFTLMAIGTAVQAGTADLRLCLAGLLVLGFGVSFAIPSLVAAVVSAMPPHLNGTGSGALNTARQTGAVLGVAVLGAVLNAAGARAAFVVAAVLLAAGALLATGLRPAVAS